MQALANALAACDLAETGERDAPSGRCHLRSWRHGATHAARRARMSHPAAD
jgi:hypothetical protein